MAGGNDLEVKFGGDASGVTAAAHKAESDIKGVANSVSGLQGVFQRAGGGLDGFKAKLGGLNSGHVAEGLEGGFKKLEGTFGGLVSATSGGVGSMIGSFGGLASAFSGVASALGPVGIAIGAVVAGLALLVTGAYKATEAVMEFGKKMAEAIEHLSNLSKKTGIAVVEMSALSQVAKNVGVGTDAFGMGMIRLERTLVAAQGGSKKAAAAFKELGIDASTAKDPLEVVMQISDRFKSAPDGIQKTALAMQLMGRAGASMIPILDQGRAALEEQKRTAEEYGAVVDADLVQKGLEAKEAFNEQREGAEGLKNELFRELAPAITGLTTYFNGLVKEMIKSYREGGIVKQVMHGIAIAFKVLGTIIIGTIGIFRVLIDVCAVVVDGLIAIGMAATGNFGQAVTYAKAMVGHIKDIGSAATGSVKAIGQLWSGRGFKAGAEDGGPATDELTPEAGGGGKSKKAKKAKSGDSAAKKALQDKLEALDREMDAEKDHYERLMVLEDQKLELLKRMYGASSSEYLRELRNKEKMQRAHIQELNRLETDRLKHVAQIEQIGADSENEIAGIQLQQARAHFDALDNLGLVSGRMRTEAARRFADQEVDLETRHEGDVFNIKDRALREQLKLQDLPVADQLRINRELEVLELEHQDKITAIRARSAAQTQRLNDETAARTLQAWQSKLGPLEAQTDSFFQSMLKGTTSFKQGLINLLDGLASTYLSMGIKALFHHIAVEHAKTAATSAGVSVRTGIEQAGASRSVLTSAASAIKQIAHHAAVAAAGAYAAIARIPYVGPFLAPAAAAAALFGVYKLGSAIFSAREGVAEVGSDGDMYQLHKQEMVLPAKFANPLRSMLSNSGPTASGLNGSAAKAGAAARDSNSNNSSNATFNYQPQHTNMGADFEELLRSDGRTLRKWLKNEVRNGSFKMGVG